MTKPRLLIPLSLQFSIRYLVRTGLLAQLTDFVRPVILLGWSDETLKNELEQSGSEVHSVAKAQWGADYERSRSAMNSWHRKFYKSCSTPIRERRQNIDRPPLVRWKRGLKEAARSIALAVPGGLKRIQYKEASLFWRDTNAREVAQQLRRLKIDAVFSLTPFLTDEEMAARLASLAGVPCSTAILSFDNLTTRPWIPITFDMYLLWNRYNLEQL